MLITKDALAEHRTAGNWRRLEALAQQITATARRFGGTSFEPVLGGGTRLMLALNHRQSDDIDLFVNSPGWLPYVSPRLNDDFEDRISGYDEDGDHVKIRLPEGEIDFIVRGTLLAPWVHQDDLWNPPADETSFLLEPPAEIMAKKLFFRGWALTARDLFDWISLETRGPKDVLPAPIFAALLRPKLDEIDNAIVTMRQHKTQQAAWEMIRTPFPMLPLDEAADWARGAIKRLQALASSELLPPTFPGPI